MFSCIYCNAVQNSALAFCRLWVLIAVPFPFVVFLPVWLYVTSKIKNFDINNTIFVLFLLALQAVFSVLLALNVTKEKIDYTLQMTNQLSSFNSKIESISCFGKILYCPVQRIM